MNELTLRSKSLVLAHTPDFRSCSLLANDFLSGPGTLGIRNLQVRIPRISTTPVAVQRIYDIG